MPSFVGAVSSRDKRHSLWKGLSRQDAAPTVKQNGDTHRIGQHFVGVLNSPPLFDGKNNWP